MEINSITQQNARTNENQIEKTTQNHQITTTQTP